MDIGSGVAVKLSDSISILSDTKPLLKVTSPQGVSWELEFYVDQDTVDNGLDLYLEAVGADVDIRTVN